MKKCQSFKSFEQKNSNGYLVKNLPRELVKKPIANTKMLSKDHLGQGREQRMQASYLTKLIIGSEKEYYENLKRAVIEKLKDIREYDLEMIHEESRDFIC